MIQRILTLFSILLFVIILIIGGLHWKAKLNDAVSKPGEHIVLDDQQDSNTSNEPDSDEEQSDDSEKQTGLTLEQLKNYTAKLPEDLANIFKQAFYDERVIQMVIAGSPSLGAEEDGWSVQVKEHMEQTYGNDLVHVNIVEFDGTSTEFINSEEANEIINAEPDLLLFEGFTLEDNSGVVPVEVSQVNLRAFLGSLIEANPSIGIIIQPPNPIYAAINYPVQVAELKNFAEQEGLHYFDHWAYWPDGDDPGVLDYLNEEGLPNEKGHKLWAEAILNYLINK
ncbi:SGNH/GDSL hydrolase family protein [Fervidibacillus halotolerans]|uniref:SGNH/GDSL hydrolase family protein n=1 Tax=Fervidibacillus halotolerans TaxID=2980027 RepID=A0A9E8LYW9_9BACI|nr:SGNH/GDSL hydrolase family protein [Fervidibacillus halotolerans]WAA12124.1 SGNH/GDSL hydrolase family protein [Fervidibacillus halotolerans]